MLKEISKLYNVTKKEQARQQNKLPNRNSKQNKLDKLKYKKKKVIFELRKQKRLY